MFRVLLPVVCLSGMTVGHSNFLDLLRKARVAAKEYYGNYWDSSSSSPYDSNMNSWSTSSPSPYDINYWNSWDSSTQSSYDSWNDWNSWDFSTQSPYDNWNNWNGWDASIQSPYGMNDWNSLDSSSQSPYDINNWNSWDSSSQSPYDMNDWNSWDSSTQSPYNMNNYDTSASPYYGYGHYGKKRLNGGLKKTISKESLEIELYRKLREMLKVADEIREGKSNKMHKI